MENPIKMDDLGVPLFSETSIWNQQESRLLLNPNLRLLSAKVLRCRTVADDLWYRLWSWEEKHQKNIRTTTTTTTTTTTSLTFILHLPCKCVGSSNVAELGTVGRGGMIQTGWTHHLRLTKTQLVMPYIQGLNSQKKRHLEHYGSCYPQRLYLVSHQGMNISHRKGIGKSSTRKYLFF